MKFSKEIVKGLIACGIISIYGEVKYYWNGKEATKKQYDKKVNQIIEEVSTLKS